MVGTVDPTGLVTAWSNGSAGITANAGSPSGTAVAGVMQSVSAVTVSPATDTTAPGDTLRMTANEAQGSPGRAVGDEAPTRGVPTALRRLGRRGGQPRLRLICLRMMGGTRPHGQPVTRWSSICRPRTGRMTPA